MKKPEEGNELAFPHIELDTYSKPCNQHFGLTKREYFAAVAMQGMLSHSTRYKPREGTSNNWHDAISEEAVQLADALISQLNKE